MFLRSITFVFSFFVAVGSASASTVTLDFTSGTTTGAVTSAGTANGTYTEAGYNVDWTYINDGFFPGDPIPSTFNGFNFLSDCGPFGGCGTYGTQMTITSVGGGTFSVDSLDTSSTYEGLSVFANFIPFAVDGVTLDTANEVFAVLPILRNSLQFTGTTAGGSTVSTVARTTSPANATPPGSPFPDNFFDAAQADFAPGGLASLTDLTSLTIEVNTSPLFNLAAIKSLQDFGVPLSLLAGLDTCGLNDCIIPGVGEFSFGFDVTGGRNDTSAVVISGLTLSMPAVPLPASALLLLGGLGLLGAARSRRKG